MSENVFSDGSSPPTGATSREQTAGGPEGSPTSNVRRVLVVEFRDEVFSRLSADLEAAGMEVERASSAAEASRRYARRPADLLVVEVDLPDETGWLLASKLRLAEPEVRIWVYTPWSSAVEVALANFVGVDELINYGGDLWRLRDELLDRLARPFGGASSCRTDGSAGRTAPARAAA